MKAKNVCLYCGHVNVYEVNENEDILEFTDVCEHTKQYYETMRQMGFKMKFSYLFGED